MKVKHAPWIVISLVACAIAVHADVVTPDWDAAAKSWWAHVQYLAGDSLEGRETGSHGFELAAAYVRGSIQAGGIETRRHRRILCRASPSMSLSPILLNPAGNW